MDVVNKYDYYLSLQNNNLNNQSNVLDNLNNHISTRERLIRINNQEYNRKIKNIYALNYFFIWLLLSILFITSYLSGQMSLQMLFILLIITLSIYSLYLAWFYDLFKSKTITKQMNTDVNELRDKIYEEGRKLEDDYSKFINGNCNCPLNK